jgi:hypothetical protein
MKPRRILVVTYWSFADALVQAYTLPYVRIMLSVLPAGSKIFLVTLERNEADHSRREVETGIENLRFPLYPFGLKAAFGWRKNLSVLRKIIRAEGIDKIHAWCTPAGAIGYRLSKRTGIPLIIDSYEPHAESMVENGTWKKGGIAYRTLFHFEKKQTHHATRLIAAAPAMREYAREKYGFTREMYIKPACVNLDEFAPSIEKDKALVAELGLENKIVCIYAGKFGGIYWEKEIFQFFVACEKKWGERFRAVLLSNISRAEADKLAAVAGFSREKIILTFVPHSEIPKWLSLGDFALTPIKPVPSKKCCTPIKNGEYWAMGLPVVIPPDISEDSAIIEQENAGAIIAGLGEAELDKTVEKINSILNNEPALLLHRRIRNLALRYRNFNIAKDIYREIYGR